ncbi:MAG: hypothetical protein KAS63_05545 [Candidatus Heimdallarchaeota archaeon]|nr:hypothetical protein [Candidatus Heimdallarchaeota archaeon]MCK4954802.1 hypothetical protein [Candidatus Heimdallarchaeota archaeon]
MSKPKKYKGETIFDHIPDYSPTITVDSPVFTKLPPEKKDSRLKDVEREVIQYWDILHPMLKEYILMIIRYLNDFGEGTEAISHLRRSLDIELDNSSELSEENRKLKSELSNIVLEKKSIEEKISDMRKQAPAVSGEELQSMKLMLSSKADLTVENFADMLKKAVQTAKESEEIKKAKEDRDKMSKELEDAKKHFERTQAEVGETFQKKLLDCQAQIDKLEEELAKKT